MIAPKLRFSEFKDDWSNALLGELSDIKTGPFGSTLHQEDYVKVGTPIITVEHLGEVSLTTQNLPLVSNEDKKRLNSYILKEGDLAFSRVGSVDRCAIITNNEEGWLFSGRILRVRPNKSIIQPKFLMYVLKTEETKFRIRSVAVGQTMPSLNTEILKNFSVDISNNRQEQTKIAEFLSAVDDKISQLSRQLELLNQYKKGVMQKIFSQEIRFKNDNGEDFGEWAYLQLDEVLDYEQPTKYIVESTEYDNIFQTPVLTAGKSFILGYTNETNGIFEAKKENVIIFDDFTTAYKFVDFDFKVKSSAMKILKVKNENFDIRYIYATFSLLQLPLGDEHKRRWISEYSLQEIPVPTIQEQEKIAEFLTAIDERIDHTTAQLTHTKQWKKGLLQQMFV